MLQFCFNTCTVTEMQSIYNIQSIILQKHNEQFHLATHENNSLW